MKGPFRIEHPEKGAKQTGASSKDNFNFYLDRLLKMIPAEVVGLYLVGSGLVPKNQNEALLIWSIVCLIGVVAVKAYGTRSVDNAPDWTHVGISSVAFLIWLYTLGGPFEAANLHVPYIGSLMVLAWTFFVPFFYKGAPA